MRQFFLLPGLVCSTWLLTAALDRPLLFSDSSPAFVSRSAETPAGPLLDQVMAALSPERVHWLDMTVWQKMSGEGAYEAEGRYLVGPGQRMRLDLKVRTADKIGRVLVVSDGLTLQEGCWALGEPAVPMVTPLVSQEELLRDPRALVQARHNLLESRGLGGLLPLFRKVRASLTQVRRQPGKWHDRPVIKLAGAWKVPEDSLKLLPSDLRARRCQLIVDAETLWPFRLEWIGSAEPHDHPVMLLQMEFRDPVINRALDQAECAREFQFGGENF